MQTRKARLEVCVEKVVVEHEPTIYMFNGLKIKG